MSCCLEIVEVGLKAMRRTMFSPLEMPPARCEEAVRRRNRARPRGVACGIACAVNETSKQSVSPWKPVGPRPQRPFGQQNIKSCGTAAGKGGSRWRFAR